MSTFTPNKNIEQPANGSYNSDWNVPVNNDWSIIDTALGGNTKIVVTGAAGGAHGLSLAQYQPPNIEFIGVLSASLDYLLPAGVGGMWSVFNNTSGAFSLTLSVVGGTTVSLTQGERTLVICDGITLQVAQTPLSAGSPSALVGLATVNGTATTFMTSDSSPAIDQSIAPTWTGEHIFSAAANFTGSMGIFCNAVVSYGREINASAGAILVPTQSAGDNSLNAASTAFIASSFAPLASPPFTGTPTVPTAAAGTNNMQAASTAFAQGPGKSLAANGWIELPSGLIIQWGISSFSSSSSSITFSAVTGKAFPNNCFMAIANAFGSSATAYVISVSATTLTAVNGISGTNSWIAFGN